MLSVGTKLGPYEIAAPLGAGGMGEVYRARDTRLERTVAIKILPAHLSCDAVRKQRFEREAKTISNLNHPHICVLYDVGHQDGTDYLVMECVEGETLAKRLEKGPLPLEQVLKFGAQIADALDKAHRAGIVHRDLKPGNIMLTPAGAKLLDFGLAKPAATAVSGMTLTAAAASPTTPVTQEGTIVGTFQYMSPEQVEGKELDGRSDIFSLGAVLYEMLTGKRAFEGKTQLSVASAILEKEPAPISSIKPLTPPALDHGIRRCLAKDPEERWQTARDLMLELKWIAEGGPQAGVPAPDIPLRKLREHIAWITTVAVLTIAAALVGIAYFSRAPKPEQPITSQILPPENTKFMFTGLSGGPPVLSPDGTLLAFSARGADGKQLLWVRSLKDATEQPLAGTEGATVPFWSPDSRSLGFFANGKLNRIDAGGGPVLPVCNALSSRGADWGPDGTILFDYLSGPILRVSASGGTPLPVTKLNEFQFSHRWPQFLPDGRHFLFFGGGSPYSGKNAVYMGSLDGGDPKLLLRNDSNAMYAPPGYLLYVRQNTLLAQRFNANKLQVTGDAMPLTSHSVADTATRKGLFSVSQNGILVYASGTLSTARLFWFDRNGRQTAETGTAELYGFPRISPDGRKLAVPRSLAADSIPIWIFDLDRGTNSRLTFDPGVYYGPVWSPDGKSLAFSFGQGGRRNIYQQAANGTGASVPLVAGETDETNPAWSPDGRYLIFQRPPDQGNSPWAIWAQPLFGDRKAFPIVQSHQFLQGDPALSPDGKWLAYDSDESGRIEAYLTPFLHGGGKWQVSTSGGTCPRWRSDGRELLYMSLDNKIVSAEVMEQGSSVVIGKVQPLFQANPVPTAPECMYDVAPDGKRFVVVTLAGEQGAQPLTLAVDWPALLTKQRQP